MARFGVFLEFWGPRGPRVGLKTSKMDLARVKTPILTPHTCLNSLWGRNGENRAFFKNRAKPPPNLCSKYVSLLGPPPQKQTFGIIGDTFCERESLSAYQKEIRGFLVFFWGWARGGPDYGHRERD